MAIYPYFLLIAVLLFFNNISNNEGFNGSIVISIIIFIVIMYLLSLFSSIYFSITCVSRNIDSKKVLFNNMIIKLMHIPTYLVVFIIGMGVIPIIFPFFYTIVIVLPIIIILVIIDILIIILSGPVGVAGLIQAYREKKLTKVVTVINCILQFVFCLDVISAVVVYIKVYRCRNTFKTIETNVRMW